MDLLNTEFKRKFSLSFCRNLKIKLFEMSFFKDFASNKEGDMYPIVYKSENYEEYVEHNRYVVKRGKIERIIGSFFPYATYELVADTSDGCVGFSFALPEVKASVAVKGKELVFNSGEGEQKAKLPEYCHNTVDLLVCCRPGAFDVYFRHNDKPNYFCTFNNTAFDDSHLYSSFSEGKVSLLAEGCAIVESVTSYIDNGVSIADIRPIRYENGEVMVDCGRVYFTASVRMQSGAFQGVFSWIPGTCEFDLTGAVFYNSGDGKWCGDIAASVLYHRAERKWYLWVCAFSHGHICAHASFEGDVRFGVNVVDIQIMNRAHENSKITDFLGFEGDEDPDFFYDESRAKWLMTICRIDRNADKYRYVFFESDSPFEDYRFVGMGPIGDETGGSFVKVEGELYFICGNDFDLISDYRIYHKGGMSKAKFDYPDGGFRGWGTLMPIKLGSRTRYFWITFDRHRASDHTWSYGNLYCFEA